MGRLSRQIAPRWTSNGTMLRTPEMPSRCSRRRGSYTKALPPICASLFLKRVSCRSDQTVRRGPTRDTADTAHVGQLRKGTVVEVQVRQRSWIAGLSHSSHKHDVRETGATERRRRKDERRAALVDRGAGRQAQGLGAQQRPSRPHVRAGGSEPVNYPLNNSP